MESDDLKSDNSRHLLVDESSIKLDYMYQEMSFTPEQQRPTTATAFDYNPGNELNHHTPKTQADCRSDLDSDVDGVHGGRASKDFQFGSKISVEEAMKIAKKLFEENQKLN